MLARRIIATLLLLVPLALPAIGRAAGRLPLAASVLGASERREMPLMDRVLSSGSADREAASPMLQFKVLGRSRELHFRSIEAAEHRPSGQDSPSWRADPVSAPADGVRQVPSGFHQKVLKLPNLSF